MKLDISKIKQVPLREAEYIKEVTEMINMEIGITEVLEIIVIDTTTEEATIVIEEILMKEDIVIIKKEVTMIEKVREIGIEIDQEKEEEIENTKEEDQKAIDLAEVAALTVDD